MIVDSSHEFYSSKYLNGSSQRQIKANWNPHESSSWLSCKFQWNVKMSANRIKLSPRLKGLPICIFGKAVVGRTQINSPPMLRILTCLVVGLSLRNYILLLILLLAIMSSVSVLSKLKQFCFCWGFELTLDLIYRAMEVPARDLESTAFQWHKLLSSTFYIIFPFFFF